MPEWLRDRRRTATIKRKLKAIDARYQPLFDAATRESDRHSLMSVWQVESEPWEKQLVQLESGILWQRADKWDVEIPDDVLVTDDDGGQFIGRQGQVRIRRQVVEPRNSRVKFWVGVVTGTVAAITGLLGALTGLVAVWKNFR